GHRRHEVRLPHRHHLRHLNHDHTTPCQERGGGMSAVKLPPPPPAGEVAAVPPRPEGGPRPPRLPLLGCGTVGRHAAPRLLAPPPPTPTPSNPPSPTPPKPPAPPPPLSPAAPAIAAARPDIVAELIGALAPAATLVRHFLRSGIPVITANKTLIAHHGRELAAL